MFKVFNVFKDRKNSNRSHLTKIMMTIGASYKRDMLGKSFKEIRVLADDAFSKKDFTRAFCYFEYLKQKNTSSIIPTLRQIDIATLSGNFALVEDLYTQIPDEIKAKISSHYLLILIQHLLEKSHNIIKVQKPFGLSFNISEEGRFVGKMVSSDFDESEDLLDRKKQVYDYKEIYSWGTTNIDFLPILYSKIFNKETIHKKIEFGFLGGDGIAAMGREQRSLIATDDFVYYDAIHSNQITNKLNSSKYKISKKYISTARKCIEIIKKNKISKYFSGGDDFEFPVASSKKKLLIIDQRAGDKSLALGFANENTFKDMIEFARSEFSNYDKYIKIHPDANVDGLSSGITEAVSIDELEDFNIIDCNINPLILLEKFDHVLVATSQMGFEALLLNKAVTVFGAPFYSGWGFTNDRIFIPNRSNKRSIEEVFYEYYYNNSSYYLDGKKVFLKTFLDSFEINKI